MNIKYIVITKHTEDEFTELSYAFLHAYRFICMNDFVDIVKVVDGVVVRSETVH